MAEVREGVESILLPFNTTVTLTGNIRVRWSHSGTEPITVHVWDNGLNKPHKQDEHYKGRTEMKEDLIKMGDLSLTLSKPCFKDRGVYICTVYKNGKFLTQKRVALCVKGQFCKSTHNTKGNSCVKLNNIQDLRLNKLY